MPALICTTSVACDMPFILDDQFDAYGQLVVVPDENWDETKRRLKEMFLYDHQELEVIETDKGEFVLIRDEHVDPEKRNGDSTVR